MGIKVEPRGAGTQMPAKKVSVRSAAQVDKDAHRRALGQKVGPRGRLSDAATGRLDGLRARAVPGGKFNPSQHPRDTRGKFK
jgi:hypothetical protein